MTYFLFFTIICNFQFISLLQLWPHILFFPSRKFHNTFQTRTLTQGLSGGRTTLLAGYSGGDGDGCGGQGHIWLAALDAVC